MEHIIIINPLRQKVSFYYVLIYSFYNQYQNRRLTYVTPFCRF